MRKARQSLDRDWNPSRIAFTEEERRKYPFSEWKSCDSFFSLSLSYPRYMQNPIVQNASAVFTMRGRVYGCFFFFVNVVNAAGDPRTECKTRDRRLCPVTRSLPRIQRANGVRENATHSSRIHSTVLTRDLGASRKKSYDISNDLIIEQ